LFWSEVFFWDADPKKAGGGFPRFLRGRAPGGGGGKSEKNGDLPFPLTREKR